MSKYNVGLKTFLPDNLSEPEFYGDLVYKFRKKVGKTVFPAQVKKIVSCYKKIGYSMDNLRQLHAYLLTHSENTPIQIY